MVIRKKAYARAGLIGNPSDGYFGKTISLIVKNRNATVSLWESPELKIELSERDKTHFRSARHLHREVERFGYYSGLRLMKATVKRFVDHFDERGVSLPKRNFTVRYASNIPRHVGLAGSSAIITAFLRAMLTFYEVDMPQIDQPTFVLGVETQELDIGAGLQDRVIQVYEGVVYMDFRRELVEQTGHGQYEALDPSLLPPLFLAYRTDLNEGSEVFHNNIRQRFAAGEADVVQAMERFAELAWLGREALEAGDPMAIGPLMDENFDLRAAIYPVSKKNLAMVQLGRDHGAHVKFSGSGGAAVGIYPDEATYERLRDAYAAEGYKILKPRVV